MSKYQWKLSVKYSPDQPRVPKGSSEGGQWTSEGGGQSGPASDWEVVIEEELTAKQFESATGLSQDDLKRMFSLRDYAMTLEYKYVDGEEVGVEVNWGEGKGRHVGSATRYFKEGYYLGEEIRECHNDRLSFHEDYQDQGLGRKLYEQQIETLSEKGYDLISLFADISIGPYAWAKQGFEYDQRSHTNNMALTERTLYDWLEMQGYDPDLYMPVSGFSTTFEVADFDPGIVFHGYDIGNGDVPRYMKMHAGKAFMLDQSGMGHGSWEGVLWLW